MNVCKVACRVAYELIGKHLPVSYHIGGKMASKIRYLIYRAAEVTLILNTEQMFLRH